MQSAIKVVVVDEHGKQETILLPGREGVGLNVIETGRLDYYFTKEGFYDGWGQLVGSHGTQPVSEASGSAQSEAQK